MRLWFQFLYGAINGAQPDMTGQATIEFQFLYGAINGGEYFPDRPYMSNFNSSMVRLTAAEVLWEQYESEFQFLYGAINGLRKCNVGNYARRFQFLYGAINGSCHLCKNITRCISIPLWCD